MGKSSITNWVKLHSLFRLSKTNLDQAEPHYFPIMSRTKGFVMTRTDWTSPMTT